MSTENTYYTGYPIIDQLVIWSPNKNAVTTYDRNNQPYQVTETTDADGNQVITEKGESNGVDVNIKTLKTPDGHVIQSDTAYNYLTRASQDYPMLKWQFERTTPQQAGVTDVKSFLQWGKDAIKSYFDHLKEYKEHPVTQYWKRVNQSKQSLEKGGPINIKDKNKGKFTASAKAAGEGVQEHAHKVMNDPNATPLQKKRANFAIQAKKWHRKHQDGGAINYLNFCN